VIDDLAQASTVKDLTQKLKEAEANNVRLLVAGDCLSATLGEDHEDEGDDMCIVCFAQQRWQQAKEAESRRMTKCVHCHRAIQERDSGWWRSANGYTCYANDVTGKHTPVPNFPESIPEPPRGHDWKAIADELAARLSWFDHIDDWSTVDAAAIARYERASAAS
jgi:hypothetical protein